MTEQADVIRGSVVERARTAQHTNADLVTKDLNRAVAALAHTPANEGDAR